jgi:hypothetical protein
MKYYGGGSFEEWDEYRKSNWSSHNAPIALKPYAAISAMMDEISVLRREVERLTEEGLDL